MNSNGVILRKLRIINRLTIKEAAKKIGKSAGWISEAENAKGATRIYPDELARVLKAYGGDGYKKQFGAWVRAERVSKDASEEISFDGAVLKYLRLKVGFNLQQASKRADISSAYLSYLENGQKRLTLKLREKLMRNYGYSPSSFKNFASLDKRASNVPTRYKLQALLKNFDEMRIEQIFKFAQTVNKSPSLK